MTFKVIRVFKPLQIRMFVELCSILQHFNWYSASGGHSAIDELLVWLANGGTEVSCFRSRCSGHTVLPFAAAASHVPRSEFPWESLLMSLCWGDAIITSQLLCAATDVDRQQRWNNAYACSSMVTPVETQCLSNTVIKQYRSFRSNCERYAYTRPIFVDVHDYFYHAKLCYRGICQLSPCVRLSVCPSVTSRCSTNTTKIESCK